MLYTVKKKSTIRPFYLQRQIYDVGYKRKSQHHKSNSADASACRPKPLLSLPLASIYSVKACKTRKINGY